MSDIEEEAVRWRAEHGLVPQFVWLRLNEDEQARVKAMNQAAARRVLRAEDAS